MKVPSTRIIGEQFSGIDFALNTEVSRENAFRPVTADHRIFPDRIQIRTDTDQIFGTGFTFRSHIVYSADTFIDQRDCLLTLHLT